MAFRRFGFAQSALLARWRDVVGPLYARWSQPESLRFPRGAREGALLTIRVEGPFAPQLQHLEGPIIARCNQILGGQTVGRLRLVQGPVARPVLPSADTPGRDASRQRPPAPAGAPAANLAGISDVGLRDALSDLAAALGENSGSPRVR